MNPVKPDINDVIARYSAEIATLTQRAVFAEARAAAAEQTLAKAKNDREAPE